MPRSRAARKPDELIAKTGKVVLPNRTIDDSALLAASDPSDGNAPLRDPLKAPGQFPARVLRKTHLDADESYGDTQIPDAHRADSEPRRGGRR
jgi:hypothetical protein